MKKQFLILFAFISVLALSQVPQRFNKVIVTGDITSPKFIKTGSNSDSVLLGNGLARAISTIKTDTVSLSNRINAKATGSGTANGTNTGDETLSSIKTKLGAATSVSDGYLKYQDFNTFNGKQNALTIGNLTSSTNGVSVTNGSGAIIGTGTAINITTASASSGGLLSTTDWNNFNNKQPSGSYEPAFSKNTAFNKNFGTTTGTVLEGRTFGTAANSAIGDFQPIENQRLSTTNSPSFSSITSTVATGTAPLTVNSATMVGNLNADLLDGNHGSYYSPAIHTHSYLPLTGGTLSGVLTMNANIDMAYRNIIQVSNMTGSGAVTASQFNRIDGSIIYHSGNLTNNLSTNYIPKWNGSTFVNATAGTDYQLPITLTTNGTSGAATFSGNVLNVPNYGNVATSGHYTPTLTNTANIASSSIIADANYSRIGNIVTITLSANVTPTLIGTLTHLTFTLPITTVSTSQQYIGSGVAWFGSSSSIGMFSVESASTAVFRFVPTTTSTSAVSGTFQYRID